MSARADTAPVAELPRERREWNHIREALRATLYLGIREIRTAQRMPALWIPNLIMPVFFYFVIVGSISRFAERFGVSNFESFQLPTAIVIAVMSGSAGLNMVTDIESGYFDKLLVTPASRIAILVGAMAADFVRILAQGLIVTVVALATGVPFATGVPGVVAMVLLAALWGLAYEAIGFALALKTGNSQATQAVWALFVPFFFLTTSFAPGEALSGWLASAATFNPLTYVLEAMRSFSMTGFDAESVGMGLLMVGLVGSVTLTLAFLALRGRIR